MHINNGLSLESSSLEVCDDSFSAGRDESVFALISALK